MNKQQKIFNILAKEQKPMKVELSLVSELITHVQESKERIKSLRSAEVKLFNIFDEAERLAKDLNAEYGFALSLENVIDKSISRVEEAAKEIGLDLNSIKELKDLQAAEQELLKAIGSANDTIRAYRSLR